MLTNFAITVIAAALLFIIGALLYDWLRKQRADSLLRTRPQLDADQFGAKFFGESAERAALAAKVRDVLAKNLGLNLDGLQPEDRLNDDLHAEIPLNPHLFWELEIAFGIPQPVTPEEIEASIDAEGFMQLGAQLHTVRDLVEHVDRKRKANWQGGLTTP